MIIITIWRAPSYFWITLPEDISHNLPIESLPLDNKYLEFLENLTELTLAPPCAIYIYIYND